MLESRGPGIELIPVNLSDVVLPQIESRQQKTRPRWPGSPPITHDMAGLYYLQVRG